MHNVKNIIKCGLTFVAITNVNANFIDAVKSMAKTEGSPADVMKKVVDLTTDEAIVCLAQEGDKIYRLHTNKKYDGEAMDTNEKSLFTAFFKEKDQEKIQYNATSGNSRKNFIAYKTHIDENHLCFARTIDKNPPPVASEDGSDAPKTSKKKRVSETFSEDNG